ncbi:peptidylprolyl isomerase [Asticcacaulis sp. 201]|uniref:peptidylprolyl isomerase n=1 Tax=Asticcacaulis sp. 201 TaxID=3028787 RepID=UPI002915D420|nr:peptidylprolyl isomerase [Asticcacaulis sp. 201]MDV6329495.1 peptidylprolyl isomerase [Asticcacaulis sp. 201]
MSKLLRTAGLSLALALTVMAGATFAQGLSQTPDTGQAALASSPGLAPGAQAPELPPLGEGILVSVNNDMITSYDLKQRMLLLIVTSGVQVTQDNYAAFQQQALNSLIDERLQQQEMTHWKVKVSDKEVDSEIARMAAQSNLKPEQLLAELKRVGVEPATLRTQIAAESGWSQLVGGRYHSNAAVGSAQVDSLMDKVIADGQKPQYLVSEIFIDNVSAGSAANAVQGARQLHDQIAANVAPFQAVARQFSSAPSAANGGDAGWLVSGNIDPAIEEVLKVMQPGQMSGAIVTKDGAYLYLLRQKTEGNSDMVFRIKQAAVPLPPNASANDVASAQTALTNFASRVRSCDAFDEQSGKSSSGIQLVDLGDAQLSNLLPNYAEALRPLKANQVTAPLRNNQNVNILYVCGRQLAGDNALTRDQVETNLVNQRLSMLGRRYLRELRSSATIENH